MIQISKKYLQLGAVSLAVAVIMTFCIYSVVHAMSSGYFTGDSYSGNGTYVFPKDFSSGTLAIPLWVGNSPTASVNITRFENFLNDYNRGDNNTGYNNAPKSTAQKKYGAAFILCNMLGQSFSSCKSNKNKYVDKDGIILPNGWATLDGRLRGPGITINWNTKLGHETYGGDNGAFENSLWDATNKDDYTWLQTDAETNPPITFEYHGSAIYRLFRTCANPIGALPGLPVVWQITPDVAVSSIMNGKVSRGETTTAYPGDTITWNHTIINNGIDPTDQSVRYDYLNSQGLGSGNGSDNHLTASPIAVGSPGKSFTSTYPVPSGTATGTKLCRATRVWSYISTLNSTVDYNIGGNGATSAAECVTVTNSIVVQNYTLTPSVDPINPGAINAGEPLSVTTKVANSGAIASAPTTWNLYRTVNGVAQPPVLSSGVNTVIFQPGGPNPFSAASYIDNNTTGLSPGDQVCFSLSVKAHGSSDPAEFRSPPQCAVVGKRPSTQIWGGDLLVGGDVTTSQSINNGNMYGSWAEYGIIATGGISGAASGAAFAGPTGLSGIEATPCGENQLSFTNAGSSSCDGTAIGNYTNAADIPNVAGSFPNRTPINIATVTPDSLLSAPGTYVGSRSGDLSLNVSTLAPGKSVIIIASGTVTIAGDQTYNSDNDGAKYKDINQLPQLVIIANSIMINSGVQNVDAWLIANNSAASGIYTCDTDSRSTGDCKLHLQVNGPVMTNHLYLRRTAGSDASGFGVPAETFNLRADAYLWSISHATSKDSIQTVQNTELPPRF